MVESSSNMVWVDVYDDANVIEVGSNLQLEFGADGANVLIVDELFDLRFWLRAAKGKGCYEWIRNEVLQESAPMKADRVRMVDFQMVVNDSSSRERWQEYNLDGGDGKT